VSDPGSERRKRHQDCRQRRCREREPIRMDYDRYQYLRTERQPNGVLLVTLSRPEVLNAAHEEMHTEMAAIWADIDSDDQTRVAVVTGAGRAFSAGGDLAMVERQAGNYDLTTRMLKEMGELVYNMANCAKPIVSAINGVAVGAGLVVALLADISICAEDARLGDGHVRLGVAAGDHAAIIWPLLCGLAKAKYYLLTGEMVSGTEAERIGLVSRAVPQEDVLPEALRVADHLATGPQQAIRLTKRALNGWLRTAGPIFDQSAAYEMLTFLGEDIKEGLASLREKRPPQFR
jgi:enoyl-CoA hydratase